MSDARPASDSRGDAGPQAPAPTGTAAEPSAPPLAGRRILVTRPADQARELAAALRALGAEPVLMPAIEIRAMEDTSELDSALRRVLSYDWVVFTSANGVRHVWERLASLGLDEVLEDGEEGRRPGQPRVAAIGPGTAAALERRGVRPDYVPPEYVAEALADGLPGAESASILLLRADVARPALRDRLEARGAEVDDVAAYRTSTIAADAGPGSEIWSGPARPPPASHPRSTGEPASGIISVGRGIDAVTFTSPSTVWGYLRQTGGVPAGSAVACIGPVTARAAREFGLRVDAVASEYTIPGLVEALVRLFTGQPVASEGAFRVD